jgi:transcriptional antiterminator RfaH
MHTLLQAESYHADSRRRWVAVNTQVNREQVAIDNLGRQGYHTYCPRIRKRVRHARLTREVLRPLFSSYIFVELDPDFQPWHPILSTIGVRTLVRCGESLSFLPDGLIDTLKAREIEGAVVRPASPYKIGQQVRVTCGAFDGLVATIIQMDERDRLVVLLDILNRPVNAKLSVHQVTTT